MKTCTKNLRLLLVPLILLLGFTVSPLGVSADSLQDQLNQLNSQISQIESDKAQIQQQMNSNTYTIEGYNSQLTKLYGEAKIFDDQINELNLQIKLLQTQVQQVKDQIEQKKAEIRKTQEEIQILNNESNTRIEDSFVNFRMYGENDASASALNIKNINSYFKTSQYKEFIQSDTNQLLVKLAGLQNELADKQAQLNDELVKIEKDKEEIQLKQTDLQQQKQEEDIKIAQYMVSLTNLQSLNSNNQLKVFAMSQDENVKRAEANKIQAEILNSFVPTSQGQYVSAGTPIGQKGCTGLCTGAHLHFMVYINGAMQNPCGYLPAGVIGGCGVGGSLLGAWPLHGPISLTSGYGRRCFWWGNKDYCDFHTGIDLVSDPWNAPVYSVIDGYVHKGVDPYGANYIIVCQHPNCTGIKLGYWHLSKM